MNPCLHCSTPTLQEKFCCRGCESVYHLIHEDGLGLFYELKAGDSLSPLREMPFQQKNWQWLEDVKLTATPSQVGNLTLQLGLTGMSCMACIWLVETVVKKHPGIIDVVADNARGSLEITLIPGQTDLTALADALQKLGYEILPERLDHHSNASSSPLIVRLGICGSLAMNTMAFTLPRYTGMDTSNELHNLLTTVAISSSTLTMLIGGSYFFNRAWSALRNGGIHMDLPISLGLIIAYIGSLIGWATGHDDLFYFDFVAVFTFLMILGKHIQLTSLSRASAKFQTHSTTPDSYRSATHDGTPIPTTQIQENDSIIIPPGSVVPTDARLLDDSADISLAWLTGEPTSLLYHQGDPIPAGAVNQTAHPVTVQTTCASSPDSTIGKLLSLSSNTPEARQNNQKFIQRYLIFVLIIGILSAGAWFAFTNDLVKSTQVLISIYVISCPCGIGLALPLLDTRICKHAQRQGIFPLTTRIWNHLSSITKLVFDKTGTLTLDKPTLVDSSTLFELSPLHKEILLSLTRASLHPLSRSLFSALIKNGITHSSIVAAVTETPGVGTSLSLVNGDTFQLGRPHSPSTPTDDLTCTFSKNHQPIATFHFTETPRNAASASLAALSLPSPPMILSGDDASRVEILAKKLNIPEFRGNLSPEQKQQHVAQLETTENTLFIGDGINDIPALQTATLAGSPFANINLLTTEVDFLFTDDTLGFLPSLLSLNKRRNILKRRLITFTLSYNLIVLIVAISGQMSPLIAAIVMPLSSLVSLAIINPKLSKS